MKRFKTHFAALAVVVVMGLEPAAQAHKLSDSYLSLTLTNGVLSGKWSIALRDLESAVGLDANDDGAITWGELRRQETAVAAYALSRLNLRLNGRETRFRIKDQLVERLSDGAYAVLLLDIEKTPARLKTVELDYHAMFDLDPQHRGWFRLEAGGQTQKAVFNPAHQSRRFDLTTPHPFAEWLAFFKEGVWHIWLGYDHILFLLALLLPSVFERTDQAWHTVGAFHPAFWNVAKIVTAFTLAHSITLTLAAVGAVKLPSRFIESAIAGSIVLAAANNLWPVLRARGWVIAFGFGLIHGFGFAAALADFGLGGFGLVQALVGFNLGVEAGQLCVVALFLPAAFLLREEWFYQFLAFRFGSAALVFVAGFWFAERLFDFKWLPF